MSWTATDDPRRDTRLSGAIEMVIEPRRRDVEGLPVRRILPVARKRAVGPFVFLDHMGPVEFAPGRGIDVRPHPHINLATVTYLFEGEIVHRDSVGSHQVIRPGEINWMNAGSGIAHSERSGPARRASGSRLHGIQIWVALPQEHEESAPGFAHYPRDVLPSVDHGDARIRVLAGNAFGLHSPVRTLSDLFYVDAEVEDGAVLEVPTDREERAAYLLEGTVTNADQRFEGPIMLIFRNGAETRLRAVGNARLLLLGGTPLDGPRHTWWNFVSSSRERIEQAKRDWKEGRFARVTGDGDEFVPLPE